MTKVSIIIPVYNAERYISKCLNSIISKNKNLNNLIEIVLIDDGSKDKSRVICDDYSRKYNFIKTIHEKNQGQAVARNKAIEIATGDWITFVDSDDLVVEGYLDVLLSLIKNNNAEIIIFKFKLFSEDVEFSSSIHKYNNKKVQTISKTEAMYSITTESIGNYMWNKLFKKDVFENIKFPIGRKFEDIATLYKCFQNAQSFLLYDDYLYFYRQISSSSSHSANGKEKLFLLRESIMSREEQLRFFKKYNYRKAYSSAKHYFLLDEVMYVVGINKYNLIKDNYYKDADYFIKKCHPTLKKEGFKFSLFIFLYKKSPKLIRIILNFRKQIQKFRR